VLRSSCRLTCCRARALHGLISLGYGRTAAGSVGNGIGADAYPLRTTAAPSVIPVVTVRPLGRRQQLACTQDHHAIDTIGFGERNRRSPTWCARRA